MVLKGDSGRPRVQREVVGQPSRIGRSGPVVHLAPNSGILFLDIEIGADNLIATRRHFVEEAAEGADGNRTVLLEVPDDAAQGGVLFHPRTHQPIRLEQWLSVSGIEAFEPFFDRWLPLPFLRRNSTGSQGEPVLDQGPNNWVRIFLRRPAGDPAGAGHINAALAFDTAIVRASDEDCTDFADLAPSSRDVALATTFLIQDDHTAVCNFLDAPWLELWLADVAVAWRNRCATASPSTTAPSKPSHELRARYLTLLKVLSGAPVVPQLRFRTPATRHSSQPSGSPDLILDIGDAAITALLAGLGHSKAGSPDIRVVEVRDLSEPGLTYSGVIPAAIEFDEHYMGHRQASRRSGRSEAFRWPSLVRIGHEARRLSMRSSAAAGLTGCDRLLQRLTDTQPSTALWRFSCDGKPDGSLVWGEAMAHLDEDGTLLSDGRPAAVRPRFSHSSLLGFLVAELLLHALVQINAPAGDHNSASAEHRVEINRIILTTSAAMPERDRQLLFDRVEASIDLVWRSNGWDQDDTTAVPARPNLVFGLDRERAAQAVQLTDDMARRAGGRFADLVDLVGRKSVGRRDRAHLRVGSLELDESTSTLTIVDYAAVRDEPVQVLVRDSVRHTTPGDLLAAIARNHIWPVIAARLGRAEVPFDPGFERRVIRPAAAALLDRYLEMTVDVPVGVSAFPLALLIEAGGGRVDVLKELTNDVHAIEVCITHGKFAGTVREYLAARLGRFVQQAGRNACDLIFLSGPLARLPDVFEVVLADGVLPHHRIITIDTMQNTLLRAAGGLVAGDRGMAAAALGAGLAVRGALGALGSCPVDVIQINDRTNHGRLLARQPAPRVLVAEAIRIGPDEFA